MTLACGTVWAASKLLERVPERTAVLTPASEGAPEGVAETPTGSAWRLSQAIDYRLVAFGALLPDIIDKPLGWVLFRDDYNGHTFGHTLLFALAIILPGLYLMSRRRDPRLLTVGVAVLTHLLADPVAHAPNNLFWPLLGLEFSHATLLGPWGTVTTEAAAALIWLLVAMSLYRRGRLRLLVYEGRF